MGQHARAEQMTDSGGTVELPHHPYKHCWQCQAVVTLIDGRWVADVDGSHLCPNDRPHYVGGGA